ncbi:putative NAD dependent epimerase/dehydratase family protein [Burkholderiales bacterium]|nr:putative NAD dependent epimerase/dehydratase family protein [Burkholderiales bacterium]
MQVVVTGAGTALGQSVLRAIVAHGTLRRGDGDPTPVRRIIAVDRTQPAELFLDSRIEYVRGDYEQSRFLARMMGASTDSVFHLSALGAGVALGPPLADLDTALLHSIDTTRALLDACRFQTAPPKLVFASTVDAGLPSGPWPQSTGGACVAMCELLLVEGSRRQIIDARCVRLPCLVGNRSCRQAFALEALLADLVAGRASPDAGEGLTPIAVGLPDEAALALLEAHEQPRAADGMSGFTEVPGRRIRIGDLVAAAGAPSPRGLPGP